MRLRPVLSCDAIEESADAFRARYARDQIGPLNIERIIEFGLQIEIRPIRGLCRRLKSKGWLTNTGRTIVVDNGIMRDQPEAYRELITHEAAHVELHCDLLETFRERDDFLPFHLSISREKLSVIEWEALEWGGRVLMPRRQLASVVESTIVELMPIVTESVAPQMAHLILRDLATADAAARFGVTPSIAEARIRRDGLWRRFAPTPAGSFNRADETSTGEYPA